MMPARILTAHIIMAYIAMVRAGLHRNIDAAILGPLYSYGLHSHDPGSFGPCGHGRLYSCQQVFAETWKLQFSDPCIVMAYIVMACIVNYGPSSHGPCSYGLCSYVQSSSN